MQTFPIALATSVGQPFEELAGMEAAATMKMRQCISSMINSIDPKQIQLVMAEADEGDLKRVSRYKCRVVRMLHSGLGRKILSCEYYRVVYGFKTIPNRSKGGGLWVYPHFDASCL